MIGLIQAKWLFEHHLQHEALAEFCKEQLNQISLQSLKDDAISSMLLSKPPETIHISKASHSSGSSTEYAALHWQENIDPALLNKYKNLKNDLNQYQFYLQLYKAVLSGLAPREAWLINKLYIEGFSLSQALTEPGSPYENYCKSTIHNRKKEILKKADQIISMCSQKGEET